MLSSTDEKLACGGCVFMGSMENVSKSDGMKDYFGMEPLWM